MSRSNARCRDATFTRARTTATSGYASCPGRVAQRKSIPGAFLESAPSGEPAAAAAAGSDYHQSIEQAGIPEQISIFFGSIRKSYVDSGGSFLEFACHFALLACSVDRQHLVGDHGKAMLLLAILFPSRQLGASGDRNGIALG